MNTLELAMGRWGGRLSLQSAGNSRATCQVRGLGLRGWASSGAYGAITLEVKHCWCFGHISYRCMCLVVFRFNGAGVRIQGVKA